MKKSPNIHGSTPVYMINPIKLTRTKKPKGMPGNKSKET